MRSSILADNILMLEVRGKQMIEPKKNKTKITTETWREKSKLESLKSTMGAAPVSQKQETETRDRQDVDNVAIRKHLLVWWVAISAWTCEWTGPNFGKNNMKTWIHRAFTEQFSLSCCCYWSLFRTPLNKLSVRLKVSLSSVADHLQ